MNPDALVLYSYWRSSAAYRVRIGLNLKGLAYDIVPVHLVRDGGEQHSAEHARRNPQELVPVLAHGDRLLTQSMAILEYLDETYPDSPALLPVNARERALVRALAQVIACDIHPLGNLRVLQYLTDPLGIEESQRTEWSRHWIGVGLDAFEALLEQHGIDGDFCAGDRPGLAECFLIPQMYNARRVGFDLARWPTLARIEAACADLPAFKDAHPASQTDAQPA